MPAADRDHPLHARARDGLMKLRGAAGFTAIVTDHVFSESFTVLRRIAGGRAASAFARNFEAAEVARALRMESVERGDIE